MVEEKLELRRIRDFGENISDTFLFVRQNIGSLLGVFFSVCGIFLLVMAVCIGLEAQNYGDLMARVREMEQYGPVYSDLPVKVIFFVVVPEWLTFVAVGVTVNAYMHCYDTLPGKPTVEAVWKLFKKYFFRVFLFSIPVTLLICIGTLFCFFPGVYLAVVLTNYFCIVVMEDASLGIMFNRCFTLIRGNFWQAFGIYIIIYLIAGVASLVIGVLFGLVDGIWALISVKGLPAVRGTVLSAINVFRMIFYIIPMVSITLHYYTLTERVDGLGLIRKVSQIGTEDEGKSSGSSEQF